MSSELMTMRQDHTSYKLWTGIDWFPVWRTLILNTLRHSWNPETLIPLGDFKVIQADICMWLFCFVCWWVDDDCLVWMEYTYPGYSRLFASLNYLFIFSKTGSLTGCSTCLHLCNHAKYMWCKQTWRPVFSLLVSKWQIHIISQFSL